MIQCSGQNQLFLIYIDSISYSSIKLQINIPFRMLGNNKNYQLWLETWSFADELVCKRSFKLEWMIQPHDLWIIASTKYTKYGNLHNGILTK
jgi:hypothetical protein